MKSEEEKIINAAVREMVSMVKVNKRWEPEEIKFLKRHYKNTVNRIIASTLDRTVASVRAKAAELGLGKNKTFMSKVAKLRGKRNSAVGA